MTELVPPEQLTDWVPGRILLASDTLDWRHVALRAYHYHPQDVIVPAMRDFMLVSYQTGVTPMQRTFGGRWTRSKLQPGATSLLTRAQRAHWVWSEPIDVTHIYLSDAIMADVASEVMDTHVSDVRLADILRIDDPVTTAAAHYIGEEARQQGMGGALYVESIARALIVHLLRKYASVKLCRSSAAQELSPARKRCIEDYIKSNLSTSLGLAGMAAELGLTPCLFARLFRKSFGSAPYQYVIGVRLARARHLLSRTGMPIKEIAPACGFTDQAHLTRLFSRVYKITPAAFRRNVQP